MDSDQTTFVDDEVEQKAAKSVSKKSRRPSSSRKAPSDRTDLEEKIMRILQSKT